MTRLCKTSALLSLLLLTSLSWTHAAWAAFEPKDRSWEGTYELLQLARSELGEDRVRLVSKLDYAALEPGDGVLVLHPTTRLSYEGAVDFMRSGGRLAIVDDYGTGIQLLERFGIHRQNPPLRPARSLRDSPHLAIAEPATPPHPITRDATEVVTNHPTSLRHPDLTTVLTIPASDGQHAALAVTGIIMQKGRLLAMGDPSAFINLMMRYPGNRSVAQGLIHYLVEDDEWGQRQGKLYLVANDFEQSGAQSLGLLKELEDRLAAFRIAIGESRDQGLPDLLTVLLATSAVLATLGWLAATALRTYRRQPPRYAAVTPLVAMAGPAGRAAVLSAPTTSRALALVELKAAVIEGFSERLGLTHDISTAMLMQAVRDRGVLSDKSCNKLEKMLFELNKVEASVAAQRLASVSEARVEELRQQAMHLFDELEERLRVET